MSGFFRKLEQNLKGRDFVVGDIHGAYSLLDQALEQAKFDPAVDRLFSVGDLVDRGADSRRCLEFLRQPWFHAVRGNHEDMLLDIYASGKCDLGQLLKVANNGLHWVLKTDADTMSEIISEFRKLPIVLEIETSRGPVGIVHADIPANMDWPTFIDKISRNDPDVLQIAIWGRTRIHQADDGGVAGIGRVFVGHTPLIEARRLGNIYAIDTGAVFYELNPATNARMTIADIKAGTVIFDRPTRHGPVDIKELPSESPEIPFGSYVRPAPDDLKS